MFLRSEIRAVEILGVFIWGFILIFQIEPITAGYACLKNPCQFGICIDDLNSSHQCFCIDGFTGYSCEINWDECRYEPCLNGGICIDGIASFNCTCPENYAGTLCEYDLSTCKEFLPCQNNGTCSFDPGLIVPGQNGTGFYCECIPGFTGKKCEDDISICNSTQNVCQNGGSCIDGFGEKFHCVCAPGWTGDNCQEDIDECTSAPCQNGGVCINSVNGYNCACPFGLTGRNCESELKICPDNPCKNKGFCLEENGVPTCYCVPDFHGKLCEEQYNECEPGPKCFNGGTCIDGVGGFNCSCPPDFFGPHCQCTEYNATDPECQEPVPPTNETYWTSTIMITTTPSVVITDSLIIDSTEYISPTVTTPQISQTSTELIEPTIIVTLTTSLDIETSTIEIFPSDSQSEELSPSILLPSPTSYPSDTVIEETITMTPSPIPTPAMSEDWSSYPDPSQDISTPFSSTDFFQTSSITSEPEETSSDFIMPTPSDTADFQTITPSIPTSPEPSQTVTGPIPEVTTETFTEVTSERTGEPVENGTAISSTSGEMSTSTTSGDESTAVDYGTTTDASPSTANNTFTKEGRDDGSGPTPTERSMTTFTSGESEEPTLTTSKWLNTTEETPNYTISEKPFSTTEIPMTNFTLPTPFVTEESMTTTEMLDATRQPLPVTTSETINVTTESDFTTTIKQFTSEALDNFTVVTAEMTQFPPTTRGVDSSTSPATEPDNSTVSIPWSSTTAVTPIFTEIPPYNMSTSQPPLPIPSTTPEEWTNGTMTKMGSSTSSDYGTLPYELTTLPANTSIEDPCLNYCQNSAKCILTTLEPICICPFKYTGKQCEIEAVKVNIPAFLGNSFIKYNIPKNTTQRRMADVSLKIATVVSDGIVLYTASNVLPQPSPVTAPSNVTSDGYALVFIQNGHVVLHFSCGSQSMEFIETRTRVNNGYNFTINLRIEAKIHENTSDFYCIGRLSVNGSAFVMSGEQFLGEKGMPTFQSVIVGGMPRDGTGAGGSDVISFIPGFRGCLYGVSINGEAKDMYDEAIDGKDVVECETFACVTNPCFGGARCIPAVQPPFWECICPMGYEGSKCQIKVCLENPCKNGATCSQSRRIGNVSTELNVTCLCPLGFSGDICSDKINITKPSFHPTEDYSSFISYYGDGIPRLDDWFQMKFHFVTTNFTQIALLLYIGNYNTKISKTNNNTAVEQIESPIVTVSRSTMVQEEEGGPCDFFSVSFIQGFLAVTWNLGSGTRRIITPSKVDSRLQIHTLYVGHSGRFAWIKVDGMRNMTGRSPGPMYRLNVDEEVYLGGYETYKLEGLPHDLPVHTGFQGCIFDLGFRVKNKLSLPTPFKARNVKNCFEDC